MNIARFIRKLWEGEVRENNVRKGEILGRFCM